MNARDSESLMQLTQFAMDNALVDIYWTSRDGRIHYANNHACKILGYTREELLQLSISDLDPNFPIAQWSQHWQQLKENKTQTLETQHKRKDGTIFPVEVVANFVSFGGYEFNVGFATDISERKLAEVTQKRLARAMKLMSNCQSVLARSENKQEMLTEICRLVVETGDYLMAWVGLADHDEDKTVRPVAQFGYIEGYLDNPNITWADTEMGQGSTGVAIRTGKIVFNDIHNNPKMSPWRDAAIKRGYKGNIALPLFDKQGIWGALIIYSKETSVFSQEEVGLLEKLANDISFGIETLRIRAEKAAARIAYKIESEKNLAILRNASDGIHILDINGNVLEASDSFCTMLGYQRNEIIGMNVTRWDAQLTERELGKLIKEQILKQGHSCFETLHRRKDGNVFEVEVSGHPFELDGKRVLFNSSRDITERKQIQEAQRIAATAFEVQEGILITDSHANILKVNQAFTHITGYSAEEVVGQKPQILSSGRHDAPFYTSMWESINTTGKWQGEIWNRRKYGEIYPEYLTITAVKDSNNNVTNYVAAFADATKSKESEEAIKELAFFDPLTKLPNRRLLQDRLFQALSSSDRTGQTGALLFIDLDNFKTINDTLGHIMGDLLLQKVAERLKSCVREGDTVARLGGDEFVVMLENLSAQPLEAATQAETIGEKILATLNQPYRLAKKEYVNTPSIGIALFNRSHEKMDDLFKQADIAMYQAKKAGRNTLRFFDPRMQQAIDARSTLENELRNAVEYHQFFVYYQIQVDQNLQPFGAEALIRWVHPQRDLVSPAEFIPIAEETGLILPIGKWVLDTACAQLSKWQIDAKTRHLIMSVNVSAKQFRQPDFAAQVQAIIQRHGIDPTKLKLELTESILLENMESIVDTMNAINALGVLFSLDDFGTGYSSLQYLKQLPLHQLKIDQSFVRDLAVDNSDKAIVNTIVAMAQSLNMEVIAEGVETEEQRLLLVIAGCTQYQGYLFGRPMPIDQLKDCLQRD